MASAGSIFVDLLLRDANYVQGLNRARRSTSGFAGQAQGDLSKTRSAFSAVISPVNNLGSAIAGLSGVLASALSVQKLVQYTDTWKQLEGRLGLVVPRTQDIAAVQQQLFEIAQRTRQPLEGVYNLYTRISQAIPEAQRGQYDLLGVTESINASLAITGEGSAQAASAILQFSQALQSDFKASAQEINSLLDSAPRLAIAIQNAFGDGTKSLKELSKEGIISTDGLLRALAGTGEEGKKLRAEFEKLPPTVGQAFTQLNNSFLQYIGQSEAANSSTSALAIGVKFLADNLGVLANSAMVLSSIFVARMIPGLAASAAQFILATRQAVLYEAALARMAGVSRIAAISITSLSGALALVGGPIGAAFLAAGAAVYYFANASTEAEKATISFTEKSNSLRAIYDELSVASGRRVQDLMKEQDAIVATALAEVQLTESRIRAIEAGSGGIGGGAKLALEREKLSAQYAALGKLNDEMQDFINRRNAPVNPIVAPSVSGTSSKKSAGKTEAEKEMERLNKLYMEHEHLVRGVKSETINYEREVAELQDLFDSNRISLEEFNTAIGGLNEKYREGSDAAKTWGVDVSEVGKDAAASIQSAFADFLFDPFEQGTKGMLKSFVDTVRRMIAEAQAAQLAKSLFGEASGGSGGGILGSLIGKAGFAFAGAFGSGSTAIDPAHGFGSSINWYADGGYIAPGAWGGVGEEGPELIYGGKTGATVIPMNSGRGSNYNTFNIGTEVNQRDVRRVEQAVELTSSKSYISAQNNDALARGMT